MKRASEEGVMKDRIRISIIVAVYNSAKYLRECMDSVVNQTIQEREILVVDDGSEDNSVKIIEEYQKLYPEIRLISKKNEGTFLSRFDGMRQAVGDYVAFVDSDDIVELDAFEKLVTIAERKKLDIVEGQVRDIVNKKLHRNFRGVLVEGKGVLNSMYNKVLNSKLIMERFLQDETVTALWKKIYSLETIKKTVKYIEQLPDYRSVYVGRRNEDPCIYPTFLMNSTRYYIVRDYIYNYRQMTESSITREVAHEDEKKMLSGYWTMEYIQYNAQLIDYYQVKSKKLKTALYRFAMRKVVYYVECCKSTKGNFRKKFKKYKDYCDKKTIIVLVCSYIKEAFLKKQTISIKEIQGLLYLLFF